MSKPINTDRIPRQILWIRPAHDVRHAVVRWLPLAGNRRRKFQDVCPVMAARWRSACSWVRGAAAEQPLALAQLTMAFAASATSTATALSHARHCHWRCPILVLFLSLSAGCPSCAVPFR